MKLRHALSLVLAFAFALPALAQNTTTITATTVYNGASAGAATPLASGTLCLLAVDAYAAPLSFTQGGGGLNLANRAFCQTVTAGALTGSLAVPNPAHTLPANICYLITVKDASSQQVIPLGKTCSIGGSTYSLDTANFGGSTYQPGTNWTAGNGAPSGACVDPSFYIQEDAGGKVWDCPGGTWTAPSGGGTPTGANVAAAMATTPDSLTNANCINSSGWDSFVIYGGTSGVANCDAYLTRSFQSGQPALNFGTADYMDRITLLVNESSDASQLYLDDSTGSVASWSTNSGNPNLSMNSNYGPTANLSATNLGGGALMLQDGNGDFSSLYSSGYSEVLMLNGDGYAGETTILDSWHLAGSDGSGGGFTASSSWLSMAGDDGSHAKLNGSDLNMTDTDGNSVDVQLYGTIYNFVDNGVFQEYFFAQNANFPAGVCGNDGYAKWDFTPDGHIRFCAAGAGQIWRSPLF
jgi:hypothetical protein